MNTNASTHSSYNPDRLHSLRTREDAQFHSRVPHSLELAARARKSMPNGVPMAWMAGLYRHPPLFVADGSGSWFRDVDGNTYLDMNQADLSMNCGYGPPAVVLAGSERLRLGSQFLLPTPDAVVVSELLAERFSVPFWHYTLSASSANTEALRLAHVATEREKIVVFEGSYHGHLDDTLVVRDGTNIMPILLGTSSQVAMMNIAVMALVTVLIFSEKVFPIGPRIAQLAALILIVYGVLVIFMPNLLPTMQVPM